MRINPVLQLSVLGLVSSVSHASENFLPPLDAFENKPYEKILLGLKPDVDSSAHTFPALSPGSVVAFFIDHEEKVRRVLCDAVEAKVTAPQVLRQIEAFNLGGGQSSTNQSLSLASSTKESGSKAATQTLNTLSFADSNNANSTASTLSVSSEELSADTRTTTSQVEVSGQALVKNSLKTESSHVETAQIEQINYGINSENQSLDTGFGVSLSDDLGDQASASATVSESLSMSGSKRSQQASAMVSDSLSMVGGSNTQSASAVVSDSMNVAGFKSTQQASSLQDVFSMVIGLEKYFEDFFQEQFDDEGSISVIDDEGNAVDELIDGDALALIDDAKLIWQERVQRFSFEDPLLTYMADFPTDEFRNNLVLPAAPLSEASISCSYQIPSNLDGIHFGHHVGVKFELKNTGNVKLMDLLLAISPAEHTSFMAANSRPADITSFVPSSEVVLHRRFLPIEPGHTYQTQFFVKADAWELPKPEKEEGLFGLF